MSITPSKQTSVYRQVDAILKREDIYCGDKYIWHVLVFIDLFLRPCLCYQLQSTEQNMYVLL